MRDARRAAPSGGVLLAVLALVIWRPALPQWAWVGVTVLTALVVAAVTVGLVRETRQGRGGGR